MWTSSFRLPVDSEAGIKYLAAWAREGGFVLYPWHEEIAKKYGVSLEGVAISRPLPLR